MAAEAETMAVVVLANEEAEAWIATMKDDIVKSL